MLNTFGRRPKGPIEPAANVNTLGKVPDSSWFTNRLGSREMPLGEVVRGPESGDGPVKPFSVIAVKEEGLSPGFTIRDAAGDVYVMKFDPPGHYQLATSSEVIATKFFHAFGYHVPENYLAHFGPSDLEIDPNARVEEFDRRRPITWGDLGTLLGRLPTGPDGRFQALASKLLDGELLGPFSFFGTRPDDPNDIYRHENRRELRGLRIFAAWLNHDDSRAINTLDTFMPLPGENGGYIRHHLIDFGSTMGSGTIGPQNPRAGNEYIVEIAPSIKSALTLGLRERPWMKVKYPDFPSIGNFESRFFHPAAWRPEYPNPAFDRMLPEDAFWAARILVAFTEEMVREIVRTGRYVDREAEAHLIETLLERRRKILDYYLRLLNPLADFEITGNSPRLTFRNIGQEAGLASDSDYSYRWYEFDNRSGETAPLTEATSTRENWLALPSANSEYWVATLRTEAPGLPEWSREIRIYVRTGNMTVVGVERDLDEFAWSSR